MGMTLISLHHEQGKSAGALERKNIDRVAHRHGPVDSAGLESAPIALPGGGTGFFTALSGVFYILDGVRQLNSHPASGPAASQHEF